MVAMTEETQQRRDDRFPTYKFKRLIVLGGYYRASSGYGEVGGDTFFGIPWAALERAELSEVATIMLRVIGDRVRHHLNVKHFPVWLAMQCGVIVEGNGSGWRYAFPDKPRKVMDDYETARMFHVSESTAREYRDEMQRVLDNEWCWMMTRER
jgi:hypothetical protein